MSPLSPLSVYIKIKVSGALYLTWNYGQYMYHVLDGMEHRKNYTQMGNVFRLHNRIGPSAALFWSLGIVLAHILKQLTQPASPASLKYGRGQLGSI